MKWLFTIKDLHRGGGGGDGPGGTVPKHLGGKGPPNLSRPLRKCWNYWNEFMGTAIENTLL